MTVNWSKNLIYERFLVLINLGFSFFSFIEWIRNFTCLSCNSRKKDSFSIITLKLIFLCLVFFSALFLLVACSFATSAFQTYNEFNEFSLGASIIVPWVGFALSILLIPASASLLVFTNGRLFHVSVNSPSKTIFGNFYWVPSQTLTFLIFLGEKLTSPRTFDGWHKRTNTYEIK